MITIKVYREKKLLHIAFKDHLTTIQFTELQRALPSIFGCLPPDFILLNDFSEVDKTDFACTKSIAEMMERMVAAGVSEVLRIMPDSAKDIGCGIMATFHYPASLPVRVFEDIEEAWRHLSVNPLKSCSDKERIGLTEKLDSATTTYRIT